MNPDQIKEIADNLEMGNRCFIHKQTEEMKFVPDFDANPYFDPETWEEEIEFLEGDLDEYLEIENMTSAESFNIMKDFIDIIDDIDVKYKLTKALQKPKPFGNFKAAIDHSGDYREKWFKFKEEAFMTYVRDQLEFNDGVIW